jgi:hypothetical protein
VRCGPVTFLLLALAGCGSEPSGGDGYGFSLTAEFPDRVITAAGDSALWGSVRPGLAINLVVTQGADSIAPPFRLLFRGENAGLETAPPTPGTFPAFGTLDEPKILVTASSGRWTGFASAGTVTLAAVDAETLRGSFDLVLARAVGAMAIADLPVTGTFVARHTPAVP